MIGVRGDLDREVESIGQGGHRPSLPGVPADDTWRTR
jgi:hypothetical protein